MIEIDIIDTATDVSSLRIDGSISSLSIIPSPHLTSPVLTTTVLSPALSPIVTTSKSDTNSVTIENNNPVSSKNDKRMKKVTYFSLTDSLYCLYLRNRKISQSSIVSLSYIRRAIINQFKSIQYKSVPCIQTMGSTPTMGSTRRSPRFLDP